MEAKVRFGIILLIIIILIAAVSAAVFMGDEDEDNGNGEPSEVVAEAGPDITGRVGVSVDLNATASTGKIVEYWWDMDRVNVTDDLTKDVVGQVTNYTFLAPGEYLVTLVCEGKDGTNDTDTLTAFIDLVETKEGSVSAQDLNVTYAYAVEPEINKIVLILKFSTSTTVEKLNNVDLFVYAGGSTFLYSTASQGTSPQEQEQVKTLDVPPAQLVTNGGFTVEVRWISSTPLQTIDFTLDVELSYQPV
jgi:hypothetical protein